MKALVILNHQLTEEQVKELKEKGYQEIVYLPDELKKEFAGLTPESILPTLREIHNFILRENPDAIIIQGHNTIVAYLWYICSTRGIKVLYAYSKRIVEEQKKDDGTVEKKVVFRHEGFHEYHSPIVVEGYLNLSLS